MKYAIEISNLNKSFKGEKILNDVSFKLESGKIYGLIGKNGSGKSVLLKIICGLIKQDKGIVKIKGKVLAEGKFADELGVLLDMPGILPQYTAFENLKIIASINNKIKDQEIKKWLNKVGLDGASKKKVKDYSLGMKQKVGIAQALMENPDIILLDEPTNALDSKSVELIRGILTQLRNEGKTIILTSHNSDDINLLCDKIFEIDGGELVQ
ncbi:MAG: ABC transporter ATP-binding protein [Sarcina sp.]